eukprot:UN16049
MYLAEKHTPNKLRVDIKEKDYSQYLDWILYSEATITFPQTVT